MDLAPSQPIFRFAPSPNGPLHLGHAYSSLFTEHWARRMGGTFLLRIEDIDTARCRPEWIDAALSDLRWLGLSWPEPVRRQSEHFPDYARAAQRLDEMGLLYPCFCTRADIRARARGATDPDGAPLYPGTCRALSPADRRRLSEAGRPAQYRLDMAAAAALAGPLLIREALPTPADAPSLRPAAPARWGDVVLVRKDTPTSYHLSVVVDDALQGITHVTRGRDLWAATDIHRLLQALLGLPDPLYTHHTLILDETAEKLSKSTGASSLAALREAGEDPALLRARFDF